MILADTSVWIDHFRRRNARLVAELEEGNVVTHPVVIGELACGRMPQRRQVLDWLARLPMAAVASHAEALAFIERRSLMGRGVGYVDVQLLAAAALSDGVSLWTLDARLASLAGQLGLA